MIVKQNQSANIVLPVKTSPQCLVYKNCSYFRYSFARTLSSFVMFFFVATIIS